MSRRMASPSDDTSMPVGLRPWSALALAGTTGNKDDHGDAGPTDGTNSRDRAGGGGGDNDVDDDWASAQVVVATARQVAEMARSWWLTGMLLSHTNVHFHRGNAIPLGPDHRN